jgi:hypothetical protein
LALVLKLIDGFLVAWLMPLMLSLGAFGIGLLFPDVSYSPDMHGMMKRFEGLMTPEQQEGDEKVH